MSEYNPFSRPIRVLNDYGDLTLAQVRDMSLGDSAEYRRIQALRREIEASKLREAAIQQALNDTSHPYHPQNPFNVWRAARQKFIDGDDNAKEEMLNAVRTEDADKYDEVARA